MRSTLTKQTTHSVSRYRKPDTVSSPFLFCLLLPSGKSYSTFQCLQFSLFILLFCSTVQNFLVDADVLSFLFLSEPLKLYIKSHQGCKTSTLSSSWQNDPPSPSAPFPSFLCNLPSTFPLIKIQQNEGESPWSPPMCWGQRCSRLKRISQIEFTLDETNRFACV